jgi:hypothetical protein
VARYRRRVHRRSAIALVSTLVIGAPASATIEGNTFTSEAHNVRLTLPRGWRWSDQPTYPGIIARMFRTRPRATMMLAVDPRGDVERGITDECRTRTPATASDPPVPAPLALQVTCQQASRLADLGFSILTIKEADRPYIDYAIGDRELRQGVVIAGESVFTLVLAADTAGARAQYARTFDTALRSIRVVDAATPAPP